MIVMTPVRNEAWVLRLFLMVTSRWADYIVIADQMSTDGSREIASEFEKVIMIDNENSEFNEAERQSMLIDKARDIAAGRDCILWGLDADEIPDAHFIETEDWKKIMSSVPGDVFFFQWAEICPDKQHYWYSPKTYYPWMFHDDGKEPHHNYVRKMHSMRIPYPIKERQIHYVNDFKILHLAYVNPSRVSSKRRFYTFVDWSLNKRNPITLNRSYAQTKILDDVLILPSDMTYNQNRDGIDMWGLVDCKSSITWMDEYILHRISEFNKQDIRKLDIWDSDFLYSYGITDPRRFLDKCIHKYLSLTCKKTRNIFIRVIDKLLKISY